MSARQDLFLVYFSSTCLSDRDLSGIDFGLFFPVSLRSHTSTKYNLVLNVIGDMGAWRYRTNFIGHTEAFLDRFYPAEFYQNRKRSCEIGTKVYSYCGGTDLYFSTQIVFSL